MQRALIGISLFAVLTSIGLLVERLVLRGRRDVPVAALVATPGPPAAALPPAAEPEPGVAAPVAAATAAAVEEPEEEAAEEEDDDDDVPSAPAVAGEGRLVVTSVPWADVYIDKRRVGRTPQFRELSLPPGKYKLKLVSPYRETYVERIEIAAGKTLKRKVKLKAER